MPSLAGAGSAVSTLTVVSTVESSVAHPDNAAIHPPIASPPSNHVIVWFLDLQRIHLSCSLEGSARTPPPWAILVGATRAFASHAHSLRGSRRSGSRDGGRSHAVAIDARSREG